MTPAERAWHIEECSQYAQHLPDYEEYARILRQVLHAICHTHAPLAIVDVRAKSLASFSEKMVRKLDEYMKTGRRPTDCCGGRVITETQADVARISERIEQLFVVDRANSIDVRSRLKADEFGYLSVHYVVRPGAARIGGVAIPEKLSELPAEIQVRTFLQHAWASISHDRIYKSPFRVPPRWHRDLARVAALLEQADAEFGRVLHGLDVYRLNYGVYMSPEARRDELERLDLILHSDPDPRQQVETALRAAGVAKAAADWQRVVALLEPFRAVTSEWRPQVLAEHGHALCRVYARDPVDSAFQRGEAELEDAIASGEGETRTRALAYRAWASARRPDNELNTRDWYRRALEADPANPFHVGSYVEYELFCGQPLALLDLLRPLFTASIRTCRAYVDAGIELPWARFAIGRFHLLLGDGDTSLVAYAKAVRSCASDSKAVVDEAFAAELMFLNRIHRGHELPEEHALARDLLRLGWTMLGGENPRPSPTPNTRFQRAVVVLAGESGGNVDAYADPVQAAFEGFNGSIISGGTTVGVPGLAGALSKFLSGSGATPLVIGYLPSVLPVGTHADERYTRLIQTRGHTFSAREPLQYWIDLLAAGIAPGEVRVLGIGGGRVSRFEYALALALGAIVGVMESSGGAADELQMDPDWGSDDRLIVVPRDAMSIRAFVRSPETRTPASDVEPIAEEIHAEFLATNRYKNPDPAMMPWDALRADLKESNRQQAAWIAHFFEAIGFRVQPSTGPIEFPFLTDEEVERLAEMEHGRWNVERLLSRWHPGPTRDPANKITPYLTAWDRLRDDIKQYDRDAVRSWPRLLAKVGLELVR